MMNETKIQGPCVGIDLGTTYSCVGIMKNNSVEIIANDQGNRTTPSYVAFTESERLIGEAAKNQSAMNPTNTIFDAKRLIGRTFDDPIVQDDKKKWPFEVVNKDNKPFIQVKVGEETKTFSAEEISAMILSKMKQSAEAFLGEEVKNATITVPAYFNNQQRQSTKDAGSIAGLNVLRIINEPTAAAIAYGLDNNSNVEKNIFIADIGGGTSDFSLLTIDEGVFEVKATKGLAHMGGEDFDNRLMEHFARGFNKKNNVDVTTNKRAMRRLRTACERAKRTLSSSTKADIEIDSFIDGIDLNFSITRARFEDLCNDYFTSIIEPINQVLSDSGVSKSQVDEVVLVGGSTRIPKLQQILKDLFNGKELCKSVNPDEAVAYGATIQASVLSGDKSASDILLIDVAPLSLGIETNGQIMTKIIERNTTVPCKKSQVFSTFQDNQDVVTIQIFEGERHFTRDNHKLDTFNLTGIPPAPRGVPQIKVSFDMNADGILQVSAEDTKTGNKNNIEITNDSGRLSKEEIERMVKEGEEYAEEDKKNAEKSVAKNNLESYGYQLKNTISDEKVKDKILEEDIQLVEKLVKETEEWLDVSDEYTKEQYEEKKAELEKTCMPIMAKIYTNNTSSDPTNDIPNMSPKDMPGSAYTKQGPAVEEVD